MVQRFVRAFSVIFLAGLFAAACGSDGDGNGGGGGGINSCFVQCGDGASVCTSFPGLSQSQCDQTAMDDCSGNVTEVELQEGCECPGFDDPGECTNPPPWA